MCNVDLELEVEITAKHVAEILVAPASRTIPRPPQLEIHEGVRILMSTLGRPGDGGRQPRVQKGFLTNEIAELRKRLGEPETFTARSVRMLVWEIDPEGDGAICARLSTADENSGEHVMPQIDGGLKFCEGEQMGARYVVVTTSQSGATEIDGRLDIQFIFEVIKKRQIKWVMFREIDRLARDTVVGLQVCRFLEKAEVDLFFWKMGRKMDWESDLFLLTALGGVAAQERRAIWGRVFSALQRRWLETGRGWPGAKKFGFRRGKDDFLEVDPVQWPYLVRIHEDYTALGENGRGSLLRLEEHMAALKCPLSRESLRTILRDPIYVTGEWGSTVLGEFYPGRKIEIENPISPELQAKNISLLENSRGHYSRTPFGAYLLNNIPVYHARCMNVEILKKQLKGKDTMGIARLKGRRYGDRRSTRPPTYVHVPRTPQCCRGYSVPAEDLENTVIEAVLDLAGNPTLQEAYITAAEKDRGLEGTIEDIESLKQNIAGLRRSRGQILRRFTAEATDGKASGAEKAARLVESIDDDIESLELRLRLADDQPRSVEHEPQIADLREALRAVLVLGDNPTNDQRQKRVALIGALLSKVVVHDTDDGVEIEIFGHLVPEGSKTLRMELVRHLETAVTSCHRPSTKVILSGRSVTARQAEAGWLPAWRSSRQTLNCLAYEKVSINSLKRDISWADEKARPGRLFNHIGHAKSPYEEVREEWPQLPQTQKVTDICSKANVPRNELIRIALGDLRALRNGRVVPRGADEVRQVVTWALEDGFSLDAGWGRRWDRFATVRPYLWCFGTMSGISKRAGHAFPDLAHEASAEMGLPYTQDLHCIIRTQTNLDIEEQRRALAGCLTTKELCRYPHLYPQKLGILRRDRKLIGFKLPSGPTTYYPSWQFDEEMNPLPIVERIYDVVEEKELSLWDIQAEMLSYVTYRSVSRNLAELARDEEGAEWLLTHLRAKL